MKSEKWKIKKGKGKNKSLKNFKVKKTEKRKVKSGKTRVKNIFMVVTFFFFIKEKKTIRKPEDTFFSGLVGLSA